MGSRFASKRAVWVLAPVVLLAATVVPIGLAVSPAGAAGGTSCATASGNAAFSPPLPVLASSATVSSVFSATMHFGGCVGGGVTSATVTLSAPFLTPLSCKTLVTPTTPVAVGTGTWTWDNHATSTVSLTVTGVPLGFSVGGTVTAGLFNGAELSGTYGDVLHKGSCTTIPLASLIISGGTGLSFATSTTGAGTCAVAHTCTTNGAAAGSATAPGLSATVSGAPSATKGTVKLTIRSGTLPCPNVAPLVQPIASFTETGFKPTDRLNVTAILPLTVSTSAQEVCFRSVVPFKSQSSPSVATAGTAFLLNCTQVANVPPCVTSSTQVGSNVVVKFVVPGADPDFCIKLRNGRQSWISRFGTGHVGKPYAANLNTSGGIAPFTWSVAAGRLPEGCVLNRRSGAITGKPKKKGSYSFTAQAADSEKPVKTTGVGLKITIN